MPSSSDEVLSLRELVAQLTRRVYRLEQALHDAGIDVVKELPTVAEQPAASPPAVAPPPPPSPIPTELAPATPFVSPRAEFAAPAVGQPSPAAGHDDLEFTVGSHWLNRIGIAATLIGVSYFLKLAFDNNWIGPAG